MRKNKITRCEKNIFKSVLLCATMAGCICANCLNTASATEYNIEYFNNSSSPANSLLNHSPQYASGDVLHITKELTADENIGDIFKMGGYYTIKSDPANTFTGGGKTGFTVNKDTKLTIANFKAVNATSVPNFVNSSGNGAVFNNAGKLSINNSSFNNNSAKNGGVIFNTGTLDITNSTFDSNTATNYGGAIRSENGFLSIKNSTFTNNSAQTQYGGAISTINTSIEILNSKFEGNSSDTGMGGAICSGLYMTIQDSEFNKNKSKSSGGAIYNHGQLLITRSLFSNNSSNSGNGGAIFSSTGNILVNRSTFSDNKADNGGAIFSSDGKDLAVINSLFDGNSTKQTSKGNGGAISNNGVLTVLNSVFTNNEAKVYGGAINFSGTEINISATGIGIENSIYGNAGIYAGSTVFSGNVESTDRSSGVHVYKGNSGQNPVVNLNAGNGGSVIFNDNFILGNRGNKDSIEVNVNKAIDYNNIIGFEGYSAPTVGEIIINNNFGGGNVEGIVNLYGGKLTIGENGFLNDISMNLYGGNLNLQNKIGTKAVVALNNLTLKGDTGLSLCADLKSGVSDYLNIQKSFKNEGGTLKIKGVHVSSDIEENFKEIEFSNVSDNGSSIASLAYDKAYTAFNDESSGHHHTYEITTGVNLSNGSTLKFDYVGESGLPFVVNVGASRSYSGTGYERVEGWVNGKNNLQGTKLAIFGKDYEVQGNRGISGIAVGYTNQSQVLEIYNVKKWSGFTTAYYDKKSKNSYGGAIAVNGNNGNVSSVLIDDVNFENNHVGFNDKDNYLKSYGGAISVSGSSIASSLKILNSSFSNNSAIGVDAYGGAVSIALGSAAIDNTDFTNNSVTSLKMHGYGGAIALMNNGSTLQANNIKFIGNYVDTYTHGTGYQKANGGAISAEQSVYSIIANSLFDGNYAKGYNSYGGAINTNLTAKGNFTILNSVFKNNHATAVNTAQGGAIFNAGTLNIVSNNENNLFEDNYIEKIQRDGTSISKTAEAVFNKGTINLNTSKRNNITFNDKINGENGVLNVNKNGIIYNEENPTKLAPTEGNLVLNNAIMNNTINLYNGKLSIGSDTSKLIAGDKYFNNVSLNTYGGILNTQNNQIDNLELDAFSINGNLNLHLDADLAAKTIDSLTIQGAVTGSGKLIIDDIKILSDMQKGINSVETTFINQTIANAIISDTGKLISTNEYIYDVSLINNNTTLRFEKASASLGLPEAVANPNIAVFSSTQDELVAEWIKPTLNNLQGNLTIQGNTFSIMAEEHLAGIITDGNTLNIVEVGNVVGDVINDSWKNFDSALTNTNNGNVKITHSVFSNNISKNIATETTPGVVNITYGNGAVIENILGTATVNGGYLKGNLADNLGGAIYNNSNLVLKTSAGNNIYFYDNYAKVNEATNKFANDIYQTSSGTTLIEGDKGFVIINSGLAGAGTLEKNGGNEFILGAGSDSSKYTGTFTSTAGTVTVQKDAVFFSGASEMIGGILNWETDKTINKGNLAINGGTLNVRNQGHFTINNNTSFRGLESAINIEEGSVLENTTQFIVAGDKLGGYNNGKETTFGTFINSGTLTITGDNSDFKGLFIQKAGTTTALADAKIFANGDLRGGTIIFKDNATLSADSTFTSANSENAKTIEILSNINSSSLLSTIINANNKNLGIIIYNNSATNLTTKLSNITLDDKINSLTIKDNVTYIGDIIVGSNATLAFNSENYDIQFNNNITDVNDNSILSIIAGANRTITLDGNSAITGDAFINKLGDGTLKIDGDGRGFTGTFNQDGGKTNVTQNGYIFSGIKNINSGSLDITSSKGIYYSSINLNDNTQLNHTSSNLIGGEISIATLTFKGTGATAEFNGIQSTDPKGNPIKTKFSLENSITNSTVGTSNNITFNNTTVLLGSDDYEDNTIYTFKNSNIDIVDKDTKNLRIVEFNKLTTDGNSKLNFDVDFNKNASGDVELNSDFISAIGNTIEQSLLVGDVRIRNDHDNGSHGTYSSIVLGDGLTFEKSTFVSEVSTTAYEYTVNANEKEIILQSKGASDEFSLNAMNILPDKRYFMFSDANAEVYHIGASLDPTNSGEFIVLGYNNDPTHSTISGFIGVRQPDGTLKITEDKGSLFNIAEKTELQVKDLTIEDTSKTGSGSVASIGTADIQNLNGKAYINNAIIQRTTSTQDGGAFYNNGGTLGISNSTIKQSISINGNGGAISNESGTLNVFNTVFGGGDVNNANSALNGGAIATGTTSVNTINNSLFSNNKAQENGGAIYNQGSLTIADNVIFVDNTTTTGNGGAIYNTNTLTLSSSTGNDVLFDKNKDISGLNDIYQVASGTTIVNGTGGQVIINSGFAGQGSIIKEGINELVLAQGGINTNFTGTFTQKDGTLTVNGTFFDGESTIKNGTVNWNTITEKSINSVLKVQDGNLDINGNFYLNNSADVIAADATTNITANSALTMNNGSISLDRNGNAGDFANYDKWNGAVLLNGGKLDYDLDKNNLLLAQSGVLNINGGTLTLSDETFNGKQFTSQINNGVIVNIGDNTIPNTTATITINSKNAFLNIDENDTWNSNGIVNLKDGMFTYNSKKSNGSLIAEGGTLNIINSVLTFANKNDLIAKEVNANLQQNSVLALNAGNVTFDLGDVLNGKIQMLSSTGQLTLDNFKNNSNNINSTFQQDSGTLIVKNNSSLAINSSESFVKGGDIVVDNSTLNVTSNPKSFTPTNLTLQNSFFNSAHDFSVQNDFNIANSFVNTMDGVINSNNIKNMIIASDTTAGFGIDISGRDKTSDNYTINSISTDAYNGGVIDVTDFAFTTSSPIDKNITFKVFNADTIGDKIVFRATNKEVSTPIGRYRLYSIGGGTYQASMVGLNSAVYRGQAATMAVYQNQLVIDNILLDHIMLVSEDVLAQENPNRYAATLPQFAPYQYSKENGSLWYKAYVNIEKLGMTQGLNINNTSYGSLVGADFPLVKMKKGWKFLPTAYIGYNGGHQSFDSVGMYQNGGQGGFMGTFIKNDFIGSILAYVGGYGNEMSVGGITENTGNWFAGTATKLAYNFHPTRNIIIQPTAFMSYNIFGKPNWNTSYGAMSMNSGLLNGINVAPGMNIIYGRDSWSVYGTIQYMYNINDSIGAQAGNIALPSISMRHGYIEYGIGATKKWKDRLNSYVQITMRNGGRTGIGFQLGLQYAFDFSDLFHLKKTKKTEIPTTAPVRKVIKSINKV